MLNSRLSILIFIVDGDSYAFWVARQKINSKNHCFKKHLNLLHKQWLRSAVITSDVDAQSITLTTLEETDEIETSK